MINVLFVCMGNICRSPSGEGVFRSIVKKAGFEDQFFIDSAGTIAYHSGEPADRRMRKHAEKRGIQLTSISRKFMADDLEKFNYIVAMDKMNYNDIISFDKKGIFRNKIIMMTEYSDKFSGRDVPDPYYGGSAGFELVLDIIEESSLGLLNKIMSDHGF